MTEAMSLHAVPSALKRVATSTEKSVPLSVTLDFSSTKLKPTMYTAAETATVGFNIWTH
jgi:hypothetical protein